jgi:hypothetical protein
VSWLGDGPEVARHGGRGGVDLVEQTAAFAFLRAGLSVILVLASMPAV